MAWAREQAARSVAGEQTLVDPTPTVARVLGFYLAERTPEKCPSEREFDHRRAEMWTQVLGAKKDLSKLTLHEWTKLIKNRRSGAIDARGNEVPEGKRRPVRDGTIWADLVFLHTVMNWACKWQDREGLYLMAANPARGFPMPKERNPKRLVASQSRFERIQTVADQVMMVVGRGESARKVPSFLSEILPVVNDTGRRISAVLALRHEDLRLDQGPHGSICWPADTDKLKREWLVPMSKEVRQAINRARLRSPESDKGPSYLFPSPRSPSAPVSKELASAWLVEAEKLAKVPKQDGSLWHAYRRKWATERKDLSDVDAAAAGGWSDTSTLREVYQQADMEAMFKVVSEPRRLRETGVG
jgi:hypothetical protein